MTQRNKRSPIPPAEAKTAEAPAFAIPPLSQLLGGLTPAQFMRDYWQKKPLLVRQAVPGLDTLLGRDGLFALACDEDAESRLVRNKRGQWDLQHGPLEPEDLEGLPKRNWSLLVQGVNFMLPEGDALLNQFNFLPYARLDDLMVSFAPPEGGIGPHFDSYDVFLIQGLGRRRWEISSQDDLELIEGAPLRILKHFNVDQSWELEPGDMLYLPPKYAHNGVALTDCMTWSIGFRAPTTQEVANQFLVYLQDRITLSGIYTDPNQKPCRQPGEIPAAMTRQLKAMIREIQWNPTEMDDFIGRYLSEPKPNIFFDPPEKPLSASKFKAHAARVGIRLDPRSRLLYQNGVFYLNGEALSPTESHLLALQRLANTRMLPGSEIPEALFDLLHDWYCAGFIVFCPPATR